MRPRFVVLVAVCAGVWGAVAGKWLALRLQCVPGEDLGLRADGSYIYCPPSGHRPWVDESRPAESKK